MKKNKIFATIGALAAVATIATSCGGTNVDYGDWEGVEFTELKETNIGTNATPDADKLANYTEENPLKIALVTDSGTLNDHSFNESAWLGVNTFATTNGGGTIDASSNTVKTGTIHTMYYQPANDAYDTQGRLAAMREAVTNFGANVIVLPGYLFQGAIKEAINDSAFDDVYLLALDCVKEDDNYQPYEYNERVTSVIYREEQCGFLAGYAAVMDGYEKLGFVGGMAVPAVIRYGSGYVQGAAAAAKEKGLENPVSVQYYYAGQFAATPEATEYANTWYANDMAEIIFACGGAVYQSVVEASIQNNNAPWIGVDVNQHADTSLSEGTRGALKTSAMKNLTFATQVLLAGWVNEGEKWNDTLAGEVVTVGAESEMVKLPTPEADNDEGCWGFTNYTVEEYNELYKLVQNGSIKVNSNSDNETLSANNFGVDPTYCTVNYIG